MTGAPVPDGSCTHCGAVLAGRYCHACGQDAVPDETALGSWREQWHRLWRTLFALLLRPGKLTQEHLSGGRIRYIAPFTLFLNVVAIFFLLSAATGFRLQDFARSDRVAGLANAIEKRAQQQGVATAVYLERVDRRFQGIYTLCLATLSLAGYTLIFRVMFWRRRPGWRAPFTLALNYLAFVFLFFLPFLAAMAALMQRVPVPALGYAGLAASAGVAVLWLALANRRLFGETWPRALLKGLLIVAVGTIVDNVMFFTAVTLTLHFA